MLSKKAQLLALCLLFFNLSFGQQPKENTRYKANMFYPELFGNGIFASFNYERMLKQNDQNCFSIRTGYGFVPPSASRALLQTIPLEAIWLSGSIHHFESGFGITTLISEATPDNPDFILLVRIGYRYQPPESHFLLRAGANLLLGGTSPKSSNPLLLPAIAVGLAL